MLPASEEPPQAGHDQRPVVYGYLRAPVPDEIEIALWRKEIEQFCRECGLGLETIFVDRHAPDDHVRPVGFTGLLDVLELGSSHGVVVPSLDHFSPDPQVLAVVRRAIRRTASTLIVMHEEPDTPKAKGGVRA